MSVLPETRRELERIKAHHRELSARLKDVERQVERVTMVQDVMADELERLDEAYHEALVAFLDVGDAITNGLNRGWEDEPAESSIEGVK